MMVDSAFLRSCTSIYPLLEGEDIGSLDDTPAQIDVPDIPGISRDIVESILDDLMEASSDQLDDLIGYRSTEYLMMALRVADFLGHDDLIEATSRTIASRLEGLDRKNMMILLGLKDTEPSSERIRRELENDRRMMDSFLARRCRK